MTSKTSREKLDSILKECLEIHPSRFYSDNTDGPLIFKVRYKGCNFKVYHYYKHNIDPDFPIGGGYAYVLEASKGREKIEIEDSLHNDHDIYNLYQKILSHRNQERTKKIISHTCPDKL